jgi:hypothetical protein
MIRNVESNQTLSDLNPRTNIAVLPHRTGYVSLDNAFALIEGHPPDSSDSL